MPADINVQDPANALLTVREDLVFSPGQFSGEPCCVIEDPLRGKFYRIGRAEYTLLSLLDGETTLSRAVALAAGTLGSAALTEQQAVALARWLIDCQLGSSEQSAAPDRLLATSRSEARRQRRSWLNPLVIKIPLGSPDRLLTAATPYLSWLASRWFFAVWLSVCAAGLYELLSGWDRFMAASAVILAPGNRLLLVAAWLGLKLLHESFHAVACKRFGGSVNNAGVIFIALAPVAFVDVTSCWRMQSKWQRIFVAAAGIYGELFVAALAVICWSQSPLGLAGQLAFDVALLASVNTVLFNANPLLRFDGYYMLADLVEVPNLYSSGQQYAAYLGQKYVLGQDARLPQWPEAKRRLIKCYGLAALAWRLLLYALLSLALVGMLGYLGGLAALGLVIYFLGLPVWNSARQAVKNGAAPRTIATRLTVGTLSFGCLLMLGNWMLTGPRNLSAPAVVDYRPLTMVRAGARGFVSEVHVHSGQQVNVGDALVVLVNDELLVERRQLALAVEQARIKSRIHQQKLELPKSQVESRNAEALEQKLQELDKQVESLVVRAPVAGKFSNPQLQSLSGQYLQAGAEIGVIGDEQAKELVLAIEQDDIDATALHLGTPVDVRIAGDGQTFRSHLEHMDPRATVELPHPALSARAGGPVDVKLRDSHESPDAAQQSKYESLMPRFGGSVPLSSEQSLLVHAGQRAQVRFQGSDQSPLGHWQQSLARWIRRQIGTKG